MESSRESLADTLSIRSEDAELEVKHITEQLHEGLITDGEYHAKIQDAWFRLAMEIFQELGIKILNWEKD